MNKITLWTIQHWQQWNEFEHLGLLQAHQSWIWPEFLPAYGWMVGQMKARIGEPPAGVIYPIWAWYQWLNAKRRRPDLRCGAHLPKGELGVRIEIQKPIHQVLLSDFDLWHCPLSSKGYIGEDEAHTSQFEAQLQAQLTAKGIASGHFEQYPPESKTTIEKSWERIFDPHFQHPYYGDWSNRFIQATMWQVSLDEVVKVTRFIAK